MKRGLKLLLFAFALIVPAVSEGTIYRDSCFRCENDGQFNVGFYCSSVGDGEDGDGIVCRQWTSSSGRSNCLISTPEPCYHTVVWGGGGGGGGTNACTTPIGGGCPAECFVCETRI